MAVQPPNTSIACSSGHHHVHSSTIVESHKRKDTSEPDHEPKITHDPYHASALSGKALEVETIRKGLMHSQEKPLWVILDEGRLTIHIKALNNHFLKGLFKGDFCQSAFLKYIVNLLPIHEALEEAQKGFEQIAYLKEFVRPELFRSEGIRRDLPIWRFVADPKFTHWQPCRTATDYANYIRIIAMASPEKIVGVMYALYGTIMSGGQTNKIKVAEKIELIRSYTDDVPKGSAVAFYEVRSGGQLLDEGGVAAFKREWHVKLCQVQDRLPADKRKDLQEFQANLRAEVITAFETLLKIVETDVEPQHC